MIKRSVIKEIDKVIKNIWLNEICSEYGNGFYLVESGIQCSLYHHLRNKLEMMLTDNNLIVYPEFYFSDLKYFADIAICQMDMSLDTCRLSDKLIDIAAIVELKYGGSQDYIKSDIPKLKNYVQSLGYDCQYYFGVIDNTTQRNKLNWLDKRSTNNWAYGCFTELNAGWLGDEMCFEVNSYNNLNFQHKMVPCSVNW